MCDDKVTVYFQHGRVVSMTPEPTGKYYDSKDRLYNPDIICSDGKCYDLRDEKSICQIPIPKFGEPVSSCVSEELGISGNLAYILRMKAKYYRDIGNVRLCYSCLSKATIMMLYTPAGDFERIVDWAYKDHLFDYAETWERWIEEHVPSEEERSKERFADILRSCEELNTDLVYIPWAGAQSGVVAKYQGRVYSLNGNDSRFPVLPDFIRDLGCVELPHGGSVGGPFLFYNDKQLDRIHYRGEARNPLEMSWRPFIDDRTDEERENYIINATKAKKKELSKKNIRIYCRLQAAFPGELPAQANTFDKWKETKPDKYNSIARRAIELGLELPNYDFEIVEPKDPDPCYNGGRAENRPSETRKIIENTTDRTIARSRGRENKLESFFDFLRKNK